MIQIKAHADDAAKVTWQTTYTNTKMTCTNVGEKNVLTWNANAASAEACQQACQSWGQEHVNQNSNRPCGAGYFYHKADGTPFCRLYETCEKCVTTQFAGTTFTASAVGCKASCHGKDCSRSDGFKPKPQVTSIQCASSVCTTDECCDPIPEKTTKPKTTTPKPTTTATTTAAPTTAPPTRRRRASTRRRRAPTRRRSSSGSGY